MPHANETGQTSSRWNVLDGIAISWDCGNIEGYYNTESVFLRWKNNEKEKNSYLLASLKHVFDFYRKAY
jgi:hypothetical protein